MDDFEKTCKNALLVQEELLTTILQKNAKCEYLLKYGSPLDAASFKAQVPIISYQDIAGDIQQIADGAIHPILCTDPITHFAISTGTSSGKNKIIPQTDHAFAVSIRALKSTDEYIQKTYPSEDFSNRIGLVLTYSAQQYKAKSGLPMSALSAYYYRSKAYQQAANNHTSPYQIQVAGSDWRQTTYCHLLCGLLQRNKVDYINAIFAYTVCEALRLLQREWKELCEDISSGCLNSKITDEKLRGPVTDLLKQYSSKTLAEEVFSICTKESWSGIIPQLWPRAKYVSTIVTGAMQAYVPALRSYAAELPVVGSSYASSEGLLGINVQPENPCEKVSFTVVPYSLFFEFIPLTSATNASDKDSIVGAGELEVGSLYELVVTTAQGLYRYKIGDVVKVVGFYHQSPQLAFSHRKTAVLSIISEKVDEQELQEAVLSSASDHQVEIANFTSCVDFITEEPPHYVIYSELKNSDDYPEHQVLKQCCDKIDKSLNLKYLIGRANQTIGALELITVKQGTFEKLMEDAVARGASPGQYKTPRCVTTSSMLELLKHKSVNSYRSSKEVPGHLVDAWTPNFLTES